MILNSPYISGSLTVTGNIISSGSITISGSIASASFATTSSFATTASYSVSSSYALSGSYSFNATTASNSLTASSADNFVVRQNVTASNMLATGRITAQTLVVQTVTSSIVYSSGSNIFGNQLTDVQQFTGSLRVTGSGNHFILGGNIGIGNTSFTPQRKVSIIGVDGATGQTEGNSRTSLFLDNCAANYLSIYTSTTGDGGIFFSDNGNNNGGIVYETSNDALYFKANNVERMRITSGGNVGIGTPSPNGKLDVSGSLGNFYVGTSGAELFFTRNENNDFLANAGSSAGIRLGAQSYLRFDTGTTLTERMRITSGGYVGIGTTSPNISAGAVGSTVLTLAATSTGRNAIIELNGCRVNSGDFIGYLRFFNNTAATPGAEIYALRGASDVSGSLGFATSGTEVVRITCTGNVGIGTSSPTNGKLEIQQSATTAGLWVQTGGTTTSYTVADFRTGTNLSALQILGNGVSSFGSNVAINTTGSAWGNPTTGRVLQIGTVSALFTYNNTTTDLAYNHYFDGADYRYQKTDGASMFRQVSGDFVFYNTGSGAAGAVANFTEKVRITCGGSVVIGQPTPEAVLTVCAEGRGSAALRLKASATYAAISIGGTGALVVDYPGVSAGRMNLTDDGYLYLPRIRSGAGTYALKWGSGGGEITYDTSSERYKNNIRDSIYGLCHVMRLNSKMFEYKDSNRTDVGLIAEEVYPVIPELVILDDNCLPNAVSYDRFISVLVKAVQELKCENDIFKTCLGIG